MLTLRRFGGTPSTVSPKMRTWPAVGWSKPEISRRQVVLPEPDGPSMAKNAALGDREVDAVDGADRAEVARDVLELDGEGHRTRLSAGEPARAAADGPAEARLARLPGGAPVQRPSQRPPITPM